MKRFALVTLVALAATPVFAGFSLNDAANVYNAAKGNSGDAAVQAPLLRRTCSIPSAAN